MLICKNFLLSLLLYTSLFACTDRASLQPFSSDGCSLFPDSSVITNKDWCDCCFQHDLAYWRGGTEQQRKYADLELKRCVFEKTTDIALADIMYEGVRLGGNPYFYNWYRWGYGWAYARKYTALTEQENTLAEKLTREYFKNNKNNYCNTK